MTLEDLGYTADLKKYRKDNLPDHFDVGRIISEHRERYVVKTASEEYDAEIIGNLRYSASSRSDFPAVGDWVAITEYDGGKVLIHAVFPRKTIIERQAVGKQGEKQIIASNIDTAFIIQAADRDFNVNRIERYLAICHSARVEPVIILNKVDLIDEAKLTQQVSSIENRVKQVDIIPFSNVSRQGIDRIKEKLIKGKTYCLLGSSGVGKSTLINTLAGKTLMKTDGISSFTGKGRHVTSHRELVVLPEGGIIIDNPGMREVGIGDAAEGLEITFDQIAALSENCRFSDCTHTTEIDCAVIEAVDSGELDRSSYENYLKMEREKVHFESTLAERRKKDKDFGKMLKNYKKGNV